MQRRNPPRGECCKHPISMGIFVVLPVRIELTTSPLPRGCSTTELRQQDREIAHKTQGGRPGAAETAIRGSAKQEQRFFWCVNRAGRPFEPQGRSGRPMATSRTQSAPEVRTQRTSDEVDNGFLDNTAEYTVAAGHYFMMGDNRDNSSDSRMLTQHGPVPAANILFPPEFVYFSMQEGESFWRFWLWPWSIRWGRLFGRVG